METQSGSNGTTVGGGGVNGILQWAVWKPFPPGFGSNHQFKSTNLACTCKRKMDLRTHQQLLCAWVCTCSLHSKVGSIINVCRMWIHYKDSTTTASLRTTVCLCVCVDMHTFILGGEGRRSSQQQTSIQPQTAQQIGACPLQHMHGEEEMRGGRSHKRSYRKCQYTQYLGDFRVIMLLEMIIKSLSHMY